ncbi:DNA-directed primase/polymerase protein-like isoform X2 [Dysidea avara]|uniref:DNA-directed primase/polymerase protein-like isoform X2 n=1 Tax=Dysidea avara TaxID=196820 RepID=UPI00332A17ED
MRPSQFYSCKSLERKVKVYNDDKTSSKISASSILKPKDVWRTFPRQQMAFDYVRQCAQSIAVFAYESEELGGGGKRRYLVATYLTFVTRYLKMRPPRHYYEVIPKGVACKLYFDVEYKMSANPSLDPTHGAELVNVFVKYVLYELEVCCGWSCSVDHVMDLDSSTKEKFSRHLIFVTPGACFSSLHHVGKFVHHICHKLRQLHYSSDAIQCYSQLFPCQTSTKPSTKQYVNYCPPVEDLLRLFVQDDKGGICLICDEAVYTKNRNFRLPLSSKLGKNVPLLPTKGSKFKMSHLIDERKVTHSTTFALIMDSLICNVRFEDQPVLLSFGESTTHSHKSSAARDSSARSSDTTEEGYSHSPYPEIDQFITKQLTRSGAQGTIRRWTLFPQGKLLIYDIKDYRWCENIGRQHKSNNIMIIADLLRGVYYQKCYDPDCRRIDYHSQDYIIPNDINPVVNGDVDDEWDDDDIMLTIGSDELVASIEAVENFDEFLKVEEEELSTQHLICDKHLTEQSTATTSSVTSSDQLCEGDSFLDAINWDEVMDNT